MSARAGGNGSRTITADDPHVTLPLTADDGDVDADVLGLGFDEDRLRLAEEEDELDAIEGDEPAEIVDMPDLPDEAEIAAVSADDGDMPDAASGLGFDPEQLQALEGDEELDALETPTGVAADDLLLPGEAADGAAPSARPLIHQPGHAPTRKVKAAGLGAVLGAIPAPVLSVVDLLAVPEPVVAAISGALTLLGALAAAYLASERAPEAGS